MALCLLFIAIILVLNIVCVLTLKSGKLVEETVPKTVYYYSSARF